MTDLRARAMLAAAEIIADPDLDPARHEVEIVDAVLALVREGTRRAARVIAIDAGNIDYARELWGDLHAVEYVDVIIRREMGVG